MVTPIILFIIGAMFGLRILMHILKNKMTPKLSVVLHGLVNATALILVIIAALRENDSLLTASMIIFVIAASGGLYLASIDIGRKKLPPKLFAIIHPINCCDRFIIADNLHSRILEKTQGM